MRVEQHPILDVDRKPDTYILYDGKKIPAVTGEPIAAALIAAGVRTMRYTAKQHTAAAFSACIGRCHRLQNDLSTACPTPGPALPPWRKA